MDFSLNLFIGIDIGTSGCRAVAIDDDGMPQGHAVCPLPAPQRAGKEIQQDPEIWWQGVVAVLRELLAAVDPHMVRAVAVDGTSATLLLADAEGRPLGPALMYNDVRAEEEAEWIAAIAPSGTAAQGAASALAKLLWLRTRSGVDNTRYVLHQADWIAGRLCGQFGFSDSNNSLKLGYDPVNRSWPEWLDRVSVPRRLLPKVVPPGTQIGSVEPVLARQLGLAPTVFVVAGTTDSTAAVIATGVSLPGDAVTSLGSTLVVKVVAEEPLFCARYGIYSQPLGSLWLVGGASNSGGAVLRQFFSDEQMEEMSTRLNPYRRTCLEYYPLPAVGERFPISDPAFEPCLTPRPKDDLRFFQGILEGITRIERRGYRLLAELGAPYPTAIRSVGGGAANRVWEQMRSQILGVRMIKPAFSDAAYGAALLSRGGYRA